MKKKQTAADKAFIAKLKTIGINTGGSKPPVCHDCGGVPINVVPIAVAKVTIQRQPRDTSSEQSFAA